MLDNCIRKIGFLIDFVARDAPGEEIFLNDSSVSGLSFLLVELEEDLDFIAKELNEKSKRGLIVEKQEGELNGSRASH